MKSFSLSHSIKCEQISKKRILFEEIQILRERWILDNADWSLFHTISLWVSHDIWIFLLSVECNEIISQLIWELNALQRAWNFSHSIRQKSRLYTTTNKTSVSLIIFLFSVFFKICASNSWVWLEWAVLSYKSCNLRRLKTWIWWLSDWISISCFLKRWFQNDELLWHSYDEFSQYLQ